MPSSSGRRVAALALIGATWLGLTATTPADGDGTGPGDHAAVVREPTLPRNAPARALVRLDGLTARLTGPSGRKLHSAVGQAREWLAPFAPQADREADAAWVAALPPVASQRSAQASAEAADQTLVLAAQLAQDALQAPSGQALALLRSAALLQDAAEATLTAAHRDAPKSAGIAPVLERAAKAAGVDDPLDGLTASVAPALAGSQCHGDAAADPASASGAPSDATAGNGNPPASAAEPVEGLATDTAAGTDLLQERADAAHSLGTALADAGYASRTAAGRSSSASLARQADQWTAGAREVQLALPSGCAPVLTATVGPWKDLVDHPSAAVSKSRRAVSDEALELGASVTGEARVRLLLLWWQQR